MQIPIRELTRLSLVPEAPKPRKIATAPKQPLVANDAAKHDTTQAG